MLTKTYRWACLGLLLAFASAPMTGWATDESPMALMAAHPERLSAEFWVAGLSQPDQLMMSDAARLAQNARLLAIDTSMHDLARLPSRLGAAQVRSWIEARSQLSSMPLFDARSQEISEAQRNDWRDALALHAVPDDQPTRYGLIVQRARLRSFPTDERVFSRRGDADIDRFQETAEFPGTPVVIAHESRDGEWYFVVSPRYAAWVRRRLVAEGPKPEVLAYASASETRVVTAAVAHTAMTPEEPAVSQLALDMGTRLPVVSEPPDAVINGQASFTSYVLRLPVRDPRGRLAFMPALLPRSQASAPDYLPMTAANVIRQAFKFLGERYGWGHDYDARDCSGFISEVYRSLGVALPRNTGDEARSPALRSQRFDGAVSHDERMRAIASLDVGDLIFIPGHVMMVIGRVDGEPYVIHDTAGASYRDRDGVVKRQVLNQVVVTPFLPLLGDDGTPYVDRMTHIVHMHGEP